MSLHPPAMTTAQEYTDVTGLMPFRSKAGRTLAHELRGDPLTLKTVCGRYDVTNMLEPDDLVRSDAKLCGACKHALLTTKP